MYGQMSGYTGMETRFVVGLSAIALSCQIGMPVELSQIAQMSDGHLNQIKGVTVEATLTARDPTNGQRLRDTVRRYTDSATKSLAEARKEPDARVKAQRVAILEKSVSGGAEHAAVTAYLCYFSSRRVHLFLDRPADRCLSLLEWDGEEQRKRALALGYEGDYGDTMFRSMAVLRQGNRTLEVRGRVGKPDRPLVTLTAPPPRRGGSVPFLDFSLEPVAELGLFRTGAQTDFPWTFTEETKEPGDDLLVLVFSPPSLAQKAAGLRMEIGLRPSLGFRVVERKVLVGDEVYEREEFGYASWEGRVFIKEYRWTGRGADGLPMEELLTVDRVVFSDSLPAEVFRVELPVGTAVRDDISQRFIKIEARDGAGNRAVSLQDLVDQTTRAALGGARERDLNDGF